MLSKESQLLTAFNTPFQKHSFVRMPFGLSVAAEIFRSDMDTALSGIPGTFSCANDIKIQGPTEERHDIQLPKTVTRLRTQASSSTLTNAPSRSKRSNILAEYSPPKAWNHARRECKPS